MIGTDYFETISRALGDLSKLHSGNLVITEEIARVEEVVNNLHTMHRAVDAEYSSRVVK